MLPFKISGEKEQPGSAGNEPIAQLTNSIHHMRGRVKDLVTKLQLIFTKDLQSFCAENLHIFRILFRYPVCARTVDTKTVTNRKRAEKRGAAKTQHPIYRLIKSYCWLFCCVDLMDWRVFLSSASACAMVSSARRMMSST